MNYIASMKKLKLFEEKRKTLHSQKTCAYNFVQRIKNKIQICMDVNENNVKSKAASLLESADNCATVYLTRNVKDGCEALEIEYSEKISKATYAYENNVRRIHSEATEEIQKGMNKPLSEDPAKIVGLLFSGCAALVFLLLFPLFIQPEVEDVLTDGDSFGIMTVLGIACLAVFLFILMRNKKPDQQKLGELASELKRLTNDYVKLTYPIFNKAYESLEAKYDGEIAQLTEEIKAEIGESVLELYENTPYRQRQYFLDLGMTATCEADFNEIAKECIKAEKTDQQIDLQNHINRETRDEINKSINKLNKTAQQIQEDARMHAARAAEQNERIAKQNEQNLRNQAKTLNELKKQTELSELERRTNQNK